MGSAAIAPGVARLLDSDACIDLLRGRSLTLDARVRRWDPGELGISAITVFELAYGAARSSQPDRNRAALTAFVLPFVLVPFDAAAATVAGDLRATLESRGATIGPQDLLIAAQALALGVPLVTNNEREFRRVPGLRVENWTRDEAG